MQNSQVDYKKRFYDMPLDLQELSPKPDFDDTGDFAQKRIPKLAVRGRTDAPMAQSTPAVEVSLNEKESWSSDERLRRLLPRLAQSHPGKRKVNLSPGQAPIIARVSPHLQTNAIHQMHLNNPSDMRYPLNLDFI